MKSLRLFLTLLLLLLLCGTIMAETVTLPQAPAGYEWVLAQKLPEGSRVIIAPTIPENMAVDFASLKSVQAPKIEQPTQPPTTQATGSTCYVNQYGQRVCNSGNPPQQYQTYPYSPYVFNRGFRSGGSSYGGRGAWCSSCR